MTIHHIIEDFSKDSGGLRPVISDIHHHVPLPSEIVTTKKEDQDPDTRCFNSGPLWCYSSELAGYLKDSALKDSRLFHIHGVWMHTQYTAARTAVKANVPFLISPHGMYKNYLWTQGRLKKRIYFNQLTRKFFEKANAFHAITQEELDDLHSLFNGKVRLELIPNLISSSIIPDLSSREPDEDYILFLGRIHPIKGIKMLIQVYSKLRPKDVKLKIAGPSSDHLQELKQLVKDLDLEKKVEFLGAVHGKEKFELYQNARVFVAPSYSEVIGMVNLEAAMVGTPVITTTKTGLLSEWNTSGGQLIEPAHDELEKALHDALNWTEQERNQRGEMLKDFVIKNYSWENNVSKWVDLYEDLMR